MEKKQGITILVQGFYGNRTITRIALEDFDAFMQGYIDTKDFDGKNIDRTMVEVPGCENLVIVYNKYREEERLERIAISIQKREKEDGYFFKPTAVIPEKGIALYSRCIVCRRGEENSLQSLEEEDVKKVLKYLAV